MSTRSSIRSNAPWLLAAAMLVGACQACATGADPATPPARTYRKEYADFQAKPPAAREHLKKIDRGLAEEDTESQLRLLRLMQRYSDWLDALPPDQRQRIDGAASTEERLARIAEVREEQWIATLPRADRVRLAEAKSRSDAEYRGLIDEIRKESQAREAEWLASRTVAMNPFDLMRRQIKSLRDQIAKSLDDESERAQLDRELQDLPPWKQLPVLIQLAEKKKIRVPSNLRDVRIPADAPPMVETGKLMQFLSRPENKALSDEFFNTRRADATERLEVLLKVQRLYWEAHPDELKNRDDHDQRVRTRRDRRP